MQHKETKKEQIIFEVFRFFTAPLRLPSSWLLLVQLLALKALNAICVSGGTELASPAAQFGLKGLNEEWADLPAPVGCSRREQWAACLVLGLSRSRSPTDLDLLAGVLRTCLMCSGD